MRRMLVFLIVTALALTASVGTVLAGGDKVRGDNGDGSVCQLQENPYEYGDPVFVGDGCN